MSKLSRRINAVASVALLAGVGAAAVAFTGSGAQASVNRISFQMVRSAASVKAGCLADARVRVTIQSLGQVEAMRISAFGLPPNTDFDLFVTQVPNAPFGISWYQGDLQTDDTGHAHGTFVGRFSRETFSVAPGTASAPATVILENPATTEN